MFAVILKEPSDLGARQFAVFYKPSDFGPSLPKDAVSHLILDQVCLL